MDVSSEMFSVDWNVSAHALSNLLSTIIGIVAWRVCEAIHVSLALTRYGP